MRTIIEFRRATASLQCPVHAGLAHGETVPFSRPRKLSSRPRKLSSIAP